MQNNYGELCPEDKIKAEFGGVSPKLKTQSVKSMKSQEMFESALNEPV